MRIQALLFLLLLTSSFARAEVPNAFDVAPEPIKMDRPEFPPKFKNKSAKEEIMVGFFVETDGSVKEASITSSSDSRLDRSALSAVKKWRFKPALKDGRPVRSKLTVPVIYMWNEK
jgi:periplasmic protein TonB